MEELVVVDVVGTESEAEVLCGLLRSAGIKCMRRLTNLGAGSADGLSTGGPHEVIVGPEDVESAREILGRNS